MANETTADRMLKLPSDQDSTGRTLGDEEARAAAEAVRSGTLTATKGVRVRELEARFAELLGRRFVVACSSGTAAVHAAAAALDPEPGEEFITTPITDMGALTPLLYQGIIPVFADVDPRSLNVTERTVAGRLSPRTRAIVATHLFGNPCPMGPILDLARNRGLRVIEDCAQAYLARSGGRLVGSMGDIACFSLQQGKHITCGEGGLVATDDEALARRIRLFVDKGWGYGDPTPDHEFLALNYRMSELQGAVALAQLPKLSTSVEARIALAAALDRALEGTPGIETPRAAPGDVHVYWRYCLRVEPEAIEGGAVGLAKLLKERGIASAPRYIQKPAFQCRVFRERRTLGRSGWPFTLARKEALDHAPSSFPGAFAGLESALVLPFNERYRQEHVEGIASAVREAAERLRR